MRPTSATFDAAISQSHTVLTSIEVLRAGVALTDPITSAIDGAVTLDITAATRGRLDLTIVDDGTLNLVPLLAADALAPYGNELRVMRGIAYAIGGENTPGPGHTSYPGDFYPNEPSAPSSELIGLGVYRIEETQVEDTAEGLQIRLSGQDRSAGIIDARFEEPYSVAAGTNYATAIEDVILAADPSVTFDLTATTLTTPLLVAAEGEDRWKFAQDMATSLGHVLYFDGDGVCVSVPISMSGATAPARQFIEGTNGLLLSASRRWTRQGTYNRVIATGENTGEVIPVRGVATDDNPLSPTYYYGQFGKVPRFYSSPFLATDAQCADAAAGLLAKEIGTTQTIDFGTVVNPALEPNDVARITRARAGLDEDHIIDQVTIPLSAAGVMTGRTRAVVSTS